MLNTIHVDVSIRSQVTIFFYLTAPVWCTPKHGFICSRALARQTTFVKGESHAPQVSSSRTKPNAGHGCKYQETYGNRKCRSCRSTPTATKINTTTVHRTLNLAKERKCSPAPPRYRKAVEDFPSHHQNVLTTPLCQSSGNHPQDSETMRQEITILLAN